MFIILQEIHTIRYMLYTVYLFILKQGTQAMMRHGTPMRTYGMWYDWPIAVAQHAVHLRNVACRA